MSNSPLVSYTKISPNRTSPRKHKIDTITIHCVVGQLTVERIGSIFASSSRDASSNYGVGLDGKIGRYVEEKDRSWCTSNADNDHRAITIEVASDTKHPYSVTKEAYNALIDLLVDICQRNDIKELKWKGDKSLIGKPEKQNMTVHRWFANKSCPGEYLYSRHAEIAAAVNKRLNVTAKNEEEKPVSNTTSTTNSNIIFKKGDIVSLRADSRYYNGTEIPAWVIRKQWVVKENQSGDRVVLNRSVDGLNAINSPVHAKYLNLVKSQSEMPFMVQVEINDLNIRTGPGTNYAKTGDFTGKGIFTITEVKMGKGSTAGWGKLKSLAGWISLDFAKRV